MHQNPTHKSSLRGACGAFLPIGNTTQHKWWWCCCSKEIREILYCLLLIPFYTAGERKNWRVTDRYHTSLKPTYFVPRPSNPTKITHSLSTILRIVCFSECSLSISSVIANTPSPWHCFILLICPCIAATSPSHGNSATSATTAHYHRASTKKRFSCKYGISHASRSSLISSHFISSHPIPSHTCSARSTGTGFLCALYCGNSFRRKVVSRPTSKAMAMYRGLTCLPDKTRQHKTRRDETR